MSHVNVTIAGRQFRMACEDGQEEHLQGLASDFDRRVNDLRGKFGEIGDLRLTVMTALMLADELSEARSQLSVAESQRSEQQGRNADAVAQARATEVAVAAALDSAASRLEQVTRSLNQSLGEPIHIG